MGSECGSFLGIDFGFGKKSEVIKNDKSKNEGLDLFGSGCEKMKSRS